MRTRFMPTNLVKLLDHDEAHQCSLASLPCRGIPHARKTVMEVVLLQGLEELWIHTAST